MKKPLTNCILGVNIVISKLQDEVQFIKEHVDELRGQYICFSNVHTTIMAYENSEYRRIQNSSFASYPDGGPLALINRAKGFSESEKISGPDFMPAMWDATQNTEITHYFYGSSEETIERLRTKLEKEYPNMKIVGMESPPFRPLTKEEDEATTKRINDSGANILWVGLGAPKQEEWMYLHKDKLNCVMLGVGAGFDFHAGTVKRAPKWMQRFCLEWLYRLLQDPKRLMKRYVGSNGKFVLLAVKDILFGKKYVNSQFNNLLLFLPEYQHEDPYYEHIINQLNTMFRVTVVCKIPQEEGNSARYYRKHKYYHEVRNGVHFIRVRVPYEQQFANFFYGMNAMTAMFLMNQQNYILSFEQPPVLGGLLGVIGKYRHKAKFIHGIDRTEYTDSRLEQIIHKKADVVLWCGEHALNESEKAKLHDYWKEKFIESEDFWKDEVVEW